jgi:16S rRNA (guanine527-N7)-methyltransferase
MKNFDKDALAGVLAAGARELKLELSDKQQSQLVDYLQLLFKWNSVYNLTSVRDPRQMATLHILDSLAAVGAFDGAGNVLDVGAGGGLPGIVLAICKPDTRVAQIDTVNKKTAFLKQVKAELGLANHTVHTGKVQELEVAEPFDVITSRAFADLSDFVEWSGHLLGEGGQFIALKGTAPEEEQQRLPAEWKITEVRPLHVPGLDAERHLIFIHKAE